MKGISRGRSTIVRAATPAPVTTAAPARLACALKHIAALLHEVGPAGRTASSRSQVAPSPLVLSPW